MFKQSINSEYSNIHQNQSREWIPSNLIGNDPRTTPLQLRAAIALSACTKWKNIITTAASMVYHTNSSSRSLIWMGLIRWEKKRWTEKNRCSQQSNSTSEVTTLFMFTVLFLQSLCGHFPTNTNRSFPPTLQISLCFSRYPNIAWGWGKTKCGTEVSLP